MTAVRGTVIYGLVDPRDGQVRYVGKTVEPQQRLYMHLWYATSGRTDTHRDRWLRVLLAAGAEPVMRVLEEVPLGVSWEERERSWIAALPDLTNTARGGEGVDVPRTPEWSARIGLAHRGKVVSCETRRLLRERNSYTHATHCARGHVYDEANTGFTPDGHRVCRICAREYRREWRRLRGLKGRQRQVCRRGHLMCGDNLRFLKRPARDGRAACTERICRECVRIRNRSAKAARRAA